ncbi:hypothetical protein HDZ31DRAFT_30130 [Schizophyllum fasciatum]
MDDLPIDFSHPAVRDYLALVRLQVLTPLSLLINIATVIICAFVVHPSLSTISREYPTAISPRPAVIAVYLAALYVGQIGYCILLVVARKPETKATLIKGVGFPLVLANWIMAFWAISWVFRGFIAATVFQGILILLLLYSNINLLVYHAPTTRRPLDVALIHAPVRFFLVWPLMLMFAESLFLALGMYRPSAPYGWPQPELPARYIWPAFGVVLGTNILGLIVIVLRRDIVWAVASTWLCIALWAEPGKPEHIQILAILFTALHPLALIAAYAHYYFFRGGNVRLEGEESPLLEQERQERRRSANGGGAQGNGGNGGEATGTGGRGPREVDAQAVWG